VNFINEAVIGRSTFGIGGKVVDDTETINIIVANGKLCSDYLTEGECTDAGCFWWLDGTCHSRAEEEDEIPWALILGAVGVAIAAIVTVMIARR
jgi:hypothetical protein